jgi:hypothetical protein
VTSTPSPKLRKTPFWWKRIELAEKRGRFTPEDVTKASDWVTCACGRQDKRIPRHLHYTGQPTRPVDFELQKLGMCFDKAVQANNFDWARHTLLAIETRAAQVLEEVTR